MPAANGSSNFHVRKHKSKHTADMTALKPTAVCTTNTNKAEYYRQQSPTSTALRSPRGQSPAAKTDNRRSPSVQSHPRLESSRGRSPARQLDRAQSMPSMRCGKQGKGVQQLAQSKMAARRSGPPPQERARSTSARREEATEQIADSITESLECKVKSAAQASPKHNKRSKSKSKSRERSASCSRQELALVVADVSSEDDESEEEDIPRPLADVPELKIALRKFRCRWNARRQVLEKRRPTFEKRRQSFEKHAKKFKDLDDEVYDLEQICENIENRIKRRLGNIETAVVPSRSHSLSQEQSDNRCSSCKRSRTGEASGGTENEVVILDPVDPAVVASRVRPESIVLAAESTPAQYWDTNAQKAIVAHNGDS